MTVYSSTALNDATRAQIRSSIRQSVENGNLATADNRFLDVTWGAFDDEPSPPTPAPTPSPTPGDNGGINPGGPNGSEGGGGESSGFVFEPWIIALIVVGGVLLLCLLFLCFCRPNRNRGTGDGDEKDDSSSYDDASYASESKQKNAQAASVPEPIPEEGEEDYSAEVESPQVPVSNDKSVPPPAADEDETSDSAYSSYEEVVNEEYEIDYGEPETGHGEGWHDEEPYEYHEEETETSLGASFKHRGDEQPGSSRSSFDEMKRKWESN